MTDTLCRFVSRACFQSNIVLTPSQSSLFVVIYCGVIMTHAMHTTIIKKPIFGTSPKKICSLFWHKIPSIPTKEAVTNWSNKSVTDVGYNGIPQTGFINNILNTYFHEYFPRAVNLSRELRDKQYQERFIYTTHPWLVSLYVDCPQGFILNNITLKVGLQYFSLVNVKYWNMF